MTADRFYNAIEDVSDLRASDLIGYFTYYLTVEAADDVATPSAVNKCFQECDLPIPGNTSAHFSRNLRGSPPKFVKVSNGYRLHRSYRDEIAKRLGADRAVVQVSAELRKLEAKLSAGQEKGFLKELIDCFEAGANRATIVMCWILAIDHLYDFVQANHLTAFNAALAKNTDKRIRVTAIQHRDDFSEIPEGKFIELLRSSNVISNDVRKILEEKLGTRNSSAHPSGISIKPSKVIEFVDDLIENVVLKYPVRS